MPVAIEFSAQQAFLSSPLFYPPHQRNQIYEVKGQKEMDLSSEIKKPTPIMESTHNKIKLLDSLLIQL